MTNLEPTYLRYVYDSLNKGSLNAENEAALPHGFIGLYEQEFTQKTPANKRKKVLNQLALWALFKGPVSANMAAAILELEEQQMRDLVDTYSSWFNSPESGKYQLYHERLKVYLLSKVNENDIKNLELKILNFGKRIFSNNEVLKFSKEHSIYFLKNYHTHLFFNSYKEKRSFELLEQFCLSDVILVKSEIELGSYKYLLDANKLFMDLAIHKGLHKKVLVSIDRQKIITQKIKENLLGNLNNKSEKIITNYLSSELPKNIFYVQTYLFIVIYILKYKISKSALTQDFLDSCFDSLDQSVYSKYFENLNSVIPNILWKTIINNLETINLDTESIKRHLDNSYDEFINISDDNKEDYYVRPLIEKTYKILKENKYDFKSFVKANLNNDKSSIYYSEYFSLINNPIFFQDKLNELAECAIKNSNFEFVYEYMKTVESDYHFTELQTMLTKKLDKISELYLFKFNQLFIQFKPKINYSSVVDKLKFKIIKLLELEDKTKLNLLLNSLDDNSFDTYVKIIVNHYIENKKPKLLKLFIENLLREKTNGLNESNLVKSSILNYLTYHAINENKSLNSFSFLKNLDEDSISDFYEKINFFNPHLEFINEKYDIPSLKIIILKNYYFNLKKDDIIIELIKQFDDKLDFLGQHFLNKNYNNDELTLLLVDNIFKLLNESFDSVNINVLDEFTTEELSRELTSTLKSFTNLKELHIILFTTDRLLIKFMSSKLLSTGFSSELLSILKSIRSQTGFLKLLNYFKLNSCILILENKVKKVILDEPNSSFENLYLIILREKFEGKQIDSTNYIKDLAIINDDKLFSEYYFIGRNIPVNHFNYKLLNLIRTKFHLVFFKGLITNVWFSPVTFDKISNSNIEKLFYSILFHSKINSDEYNFIIDELIIYFLFRNDKIESNTLNSMSKNIYVNKIIECL